MKTLKRTTILLFSTLLLSACGGGSDSGKNQGGKDSAKADKSEKKVQVYNYDHSSSELSITTYKHSSKTGVGIDFDSLHVEGMASDAKSIPALFRNVSFEVPVSKLNSGDPKRDPKIREHFFGTMKESMSIEGELMGMSIDGKKGSAELKIKMNGKEQNVGMEVKKDGGSLTLTGTIDVMNWDGKEALDALQKACKAKHTGEDGKTKLWSEVALSFSTDLQVKERLAL